MKNRLAQLFITSEHETISKYQKLQLKVITIALVCPDLLCGIRYLTH